MLVEFPLGDPHLMERPQTSQNTTTNPRTELALGRVSRRGDPDSRTGETLHEFLVQAVREAVKQARCPRDDDVGQQMRTDVHINAVQGSLDQLRDGLRLRWRGERRLGIGDGRFGVEQRLHHLVAVDAERLVVAIGKLEGPRRRSPGDFFIRHAVGPDGGELVGARPDLHDGLLELGQSALLEEGPVRRIWCLFGREGLVFGLRGLAWLDAGFGGNEIVRRDGDWMWGVVFEQRADLRRDVVASKGRMLDTTL